MVSRAAAAGVAAALLVGCGQRGDGAQAVPGDTTGGRSPGTGAVAGAAAPRPASNSTVPATVLFMGTSLTAGYGLSPADAYTAVLQRRVDSLGLEVRLVNAGLSGETSAGALRRLDWVLRRPVGAFVLETGANDGLRGLDVDSTRANIEAILRRARERSPGARLFLVQMEAPPNLGAEYTRRFHDLYGAAARGAGAELLPFLLEGVAGRAQLNQGDGVHPTAEGARRVANTLWRPLEPVFRALDATRNRA